MEQRGPTTKGALYPTPGVTEFARTTLNAPGAPTVTPTGGTGPRTYGYKIVALLPDGVLHSEASAQGQTTTGVVTISASTYNAISWAAVTGADTYAVYRTLCAPNFNYPVLLGTTTTTSYNDVGAAGTSASPPTTNTTGIPAGPGRAHFAEAGRSFAIIGATLWEEDVYGGLTSRGSVGMDAYPATIRSNGAGQLFITSAGDGYVYTLATNTLAAVSALADKARMGGMLDGYNVALDTITNSTTPTLYISDSLDAATWDPTRFIQNSATSDPWQAVLVSNRYLYLLGERTSQVWYDVGSSPVPFALYPSGIIQYGIAATFSAAVADGAPIWLAQTANGSGMVVRASGLAPEVISTYPVQRAISSYSTISDAIAEVYTEMGHTFYLLTFPTAQATWCYDVQSQVWHKRGTWISEEGRYRAWRPRWHAYAFGQHRWLDGETGSLYTASVDVATDVDGRPLRRVRRAPALVQENQRIVFAGFELDLERGQGAVTGQGSDPQVMLRFSDDGGETWSSEKWRSAGPLGQYRKRVRWNRMGQSRRRVFEVVVSDPIPWRLVNAYLEVHPVNGGGAQQPVQGQGQ